jgi:hypothetical protein
MPIQTSTIVTGADTNNPDPISTIASISATLSSAHSGIKQDMDTRSDADGLEGLYAVESAYGIGSQMIIKALERYQEGKITIGSVLYTVEDCLSLLQESNLSNLYTGAEGRESNVKKARIIVSESARKLDTMRQTTNETEKRAYRDA